MRPRGELPPAKASSVALLAPEDVEDRLHHRATFVKAVCRQLFKLALVQPNALAVKAGDDLHRASPQGLQIHAAIGALHVVELLELLLRFLGELLGLLHRPPGLFFDFLYSEI